MSTVFHRLKLSFAQIRSDPVMTFSMTITDLCRDSNLGFVMEEPRVYFEEEIVSLTDLLRTLWGFPSLGKDLAQRKKRTKINPAHCLKVNERVKPTIYPPQLLSSRQDCSCRVLH